MPRTSDSAAAALWGSSITRGLETTVAAGSDRAMVRPLRSITVPRGAGTVISPMGMATSVRIRGSGVA